jgi:uncharacterized repeat protein (TIGR03843 family)
VSEWPRPDDGPQEPVGPAGFDEAQALVLLAEGDLEVRGRLVDASNATLFATVHHEGASHACVYKPVAGERPLWDFPAGTLALREVAAYVLSSAVGWDVVPPTVLRDGPYGQGSVQWWIDGGDTDADGDPLPADPGAGLVDVVRPEDVPAGWHHVVRAEGMDGRVVALVHADDVTLRRMALFDVVANNADRKGGHVLRDTGGRVWGVDHGLTFNTEDKLRTVLWGWSGGRLEPEELEGLTRLARDLEGAGPVSRALAGLLSMPEVAQTALRVTRLVSTRRLPRPGVGRPSIPWPAF